MTVGRITNLSKKESIYTKVQSIGSLWLRLVRLALQSHILAFARRQEREFIERRRLKNLKDRDFGFDGTANPVTQLYPDQRVNAVLRQWQLGIDVRQRDVEDVRQLSAKGGHEQLRGRIDARRRRESLDKCGSGGLAIGRCSIAGADRARNPQRAKATVVPQGGLGGEEVEVGPDDDLAVRKGTSQRVSDTGFDESEHGFDADGVEAKVFDTCTEAFVAACFSFCHDADGAYSTQVDRDGWLAICRALTGESVLEGITGSVVGLRHVAGYTDDRGQHDEEGQVGKVFV